MLNKEPAGSNAPFNKEEMNAIMKFGAEDLFAEGGDEKASKTLDEMDLDAVCVARSLGFSWECACVRVSVDGAPPWCHAY